MRISHEAYVQVFSMVYAALVTNLLLAVGCMPVLLVLGNSDPGRSWPIIALLAPLCAPPLAAAYAVFAEFSDHGTAYVVRTFARAWRGSFRRALAVGALASGALVVLGVDVRAVSSTRVGAVAIPVFTVLAALVVATTTLGLVGVVERPSTPLRGVLRAAVYLAVRRWYLTVVSLMTLGLLAALVATKPALGLGLAAAPLLYVVWANSRYALRPVLDRRETTLASA